MSKVAIVGVEGSGKTIMLAGFADLFCRPDSNGYFLKPKTLETSSYVNRQMTALRKGKWPTATAGDVLQNLEWDLRRRSSRMGPPMHICDISFMDFAGEVYRAAFGRSEDRRNSTYAKEVATLKSYIRSADKLIVLINLSDVINNGLSDPRVEEAMWITNAILDYALPAQPQEWHNSNACIVLSQADNYRDIIEREKGPVGVLRRYLPDVANSYDWLKIFAASAVDTTDLDDDGNRVPAPGFHSAGLRPIMDWILFGINNSEQNNAQNGANRNRNRKNPRNESNNGYGPAQDNNNNGGCMAGCAEKIGQGIGCLILFLVIIGILSRIAGCVFD